MTSSTTDNDWQSYNVEDKIRDILDRLPNQEHHFGRPFITAYQLAIEYAERHPGDLPNLVVGGQGAGVHVSLASYLANQISRRIKAGTINDIEGGFLSDLHVKDLSFDHDGQEIRSSVSDLSMFRLVVR